MQTIRDFEPANRYVYDFGPCSAKNGFAQVDTQQDAWYFGIWANPEKMVVITYAEGDVVIRKADNTQEFIDEIHAIKKFEEEMGRRFLGIDPGFNADLKQQFVNAGLGDLLH